MKDPARHLLLLCIVSVNLFLFVGCSSRITGDGIPGPDRVKFRCQGKTYSSDKEFIRAMGRGTSRDESTAHRMATMDASVNITKAVVAYQQKINAHHDKSQEGTQSVEWGKDSLERESLNMNLQDVRTLCTQTRRKDNMYVTTVIVEMPF